MEEQRKKFTDGAVVNNYSEQFAIEVFDQIAYFAGYGFNKSHSVPYALLAYQTAYLKANYPAEYLAASLTAVKRDKDRTAIFLAEAREMGVNVSTPDINLSSADFTVNDNEILFGFSAVRNLGDITDENTRHLLNQVDHALLLIKKKKYGNCENCGEPIPVARLEALPYATMRKECAEALES